MTDETKCRETARLCGCRYDGVQYGLDGKHAHQFTTLEHGDTIYLSPDMLSVDNLLDRVRAKARERVAV